MLNMSYRLYSKLQYCSCTLVLYKPIEGLIYYVEAVYSNGLFSEFYYTFAMCP